MSRHVVVIDPAANTPETECFNHLSLLSELKCTYHLPGILGLQSLRAEDPAGIAAFIILGSAASVHDRHAWQTELEGWLRPHLERGVPTLGICYGHQMLAHMYGGRIDFVAPDREKLRGVRLVTLDAGPGWPAATGPLVVSHRETVVEAPRAMRVVGRSKEIAVDALKHQTLPIWSMQPHPESVPEFLRNHGIHVANLDQLAFGHSLMRAFLAYAFRGAASPP